CDRRVPSSQLHRPHSTTMREPKSPWGTYRRPLGATMGRWRPLAPTATVRLTRIDKVCVSMTLMTPVRLWTAYSLAPSPLIARKTGASGSATLPTTALALVSMTSTRLAPPFARKARGGVGLVTRSLYIPPPGARVATTVFRTVSITGMLGLNRPTTRSLRSSPVRASWEGWNGTGTVATTVVVLRSTPLTANEPAPRTAPA